MTPFGARMRRMRGERGILMKDMAEALGVSSAYLSALEHGRRGKPAWAFVQAIIGYFNVIWDEADELHRLADMSDPRAVIDTSGLDPAHTTFANRLSRDIASLDMQGVEALEKALDTALKQSARRRKSPRRGPQG